MSQVAAIKEKLLKTIKLETDAERLIISMRRTGLTAWEIAQRASINPPEISQFLNNVRTPSREVLEQLALAVGVPVQVLFPDTLKYHDEKEAGRV